MNLQFLKDLGERAGATFIQVFGAGLGLDMANLQIVTVREALIMALVAGGASVAKSIAGRKIGASKSASWTGAVDLTPAPVKVTINPAASDALADARTVLDSVRRSTQKPPRVE
ncbi:hypothetical protein GS982_01240 [Rhodococcus hoagii]|uniref:Uncharacterized protein n=1 Tax=Rhodococcus hoagii TaxID=43767 RepID=A0A9Q4ZIL2_RHOHA|nr:hypothetical protein [Prescottella equi]NKT77232.1 hypothetical protein [Prescottella equi]NKZ81016.1 hypothetical protein [Prescottella equi]